MDIEKCLKIGVKANTIPSAARMNACEKTEALVTIRKIGGHKDPRLNMDRPASAEANEKDQILASDKITLKALIKVLLSLGALYPEWRRV